MKTNFVIKGIMLGAATSISASSPRQPHTQIDTYTADTTRLVFSNEASIPDAKNANTSDNTHKTLKEPIKDWSRRMEREFRALALAEAKGTITGNQIDRLEELSQLRSQLLNPPTADEMLLRIRKERAIEKLTEALTEYVKFEEGACIKRPPA